jgi:superfamily I DNA/RNA helicase
MSETWWVDQSELDDDQIEVIGLGPDGSYLVIGPPGSGKTNLLLLRANYLCRSGMPDVRILVFTRTLREFIASGADRYSFSPDKIKTYNAWAREFLRESGIKLEKYNDFKDERANLLNQLQYVVERDQISGLHNAILLDEAHDYLPEEIEILRRFGKTFFAVADSRQQIYQKDLSIECLRASVDRTIELRLHYRNGINICKFADKIMEGKGIYQPLEPTSNYDEDLRPSRVQVYKCLDINDECEKIIGEVKTQMQAYPNELIGIICPKREELMQFWKLISQSPIAPFCILQDYESGYMSFDEKRPIIICTLHSAKGLEFRAVHLAACETFKSFDTNRSMTFTGITRAKTSLSLYYDGYGRLRLYPYLEKAIFALSPRVGRPKIAEAFGRRK